MRKVLLIPLLFILVFPPIVTHADHGIELFTVICGGDYDQQEADYLNLFFNFMGIDHTEHLVDIVVEAQGEVYADVYHKFTGVWELDEPAHEVFFLVEEQNDRGYKTASYPIPYYTNVTVTVNMYYGFYYDTLVARLTTSFYCAEDPDGAPPYLVQIISSDLYLAPHPTDPDPGQPDTDPTPEQNQPQPRPINPVIATEQAQGIQRQFDDQVVITSQQGASLNYYTPNGCLIGQTSIPTQQNINFRDRYIVESYTGCDGYRIDLWSLGYPACHLQANIYLPNGEEKVYLMDRNPSHPSCSPPPSPSPAPEVSAPDAVVTQPHSAHDSPVEDELPTGLYSPVYDMLPSPPEGTQWVSRLVFESLAEQILEKIEQTQQELGLINSVVDALATRIIDWAACALDGAAGGCEVFPHVRMFLSESRVDKINNLRMWTERLDAMYEYWENPIYRYGDDFVALPFWLLNLPVTSNPYFWLSPLDEILIPFSLP